MSDFDSPVSVLQVRGPDKFASQGGAYHAARSTSGRSRFHEGIDLVATPGEEVVAPVPCYFVRWADPYVDKRDAVLFGCLLRTVDSWNIKMLYMKPTEEMKNGMLVKRGQVIGHAQSLQHLYPGITDHIHVELYRPSGERIDPTGYFFPPSVVTT